MQHRRINQRVRFPGSPRSYRIAIVAAAVVAAATPASILLSQSDDGTANASVAVSAVDRASADPTSPATPWAAAAPATPEESAPATPKESSKAPTAHAVPAAAESTEPAETAPAEPAPPASKTLDYDFELQINYYYCGPAATRIALTSQGHSLSQDEVASRLGTTTNGTNSAEDTTRVLNSVDGTDFYQTRTIPGGSATPAEMDRLQADVVHAISKGYPIVANIAGTATDTDGGWHSYEGGHYLTVVGYQDDGRTVKIADPANTVGDGSYWMTAIDLANWVATRGYSA